MDKHIVYKSQIDALVDDYWYGVIQAHPVAFLCLLVGIPLVCFLLVLIDHLYDRSERRRRSKEWLARWK